MLERHQIAEQAPKSGRRVPLVRALEHVHDLGQTRPLIVEVGSTRNTIHRAMNNDGWATRVFAWYARECGGSVISIDPSAKAQRATAQILGGLRRYVCQVAEDALKALHQIGIAPALIYMDGPNDPQFHLKAWLALPNKAPLVLIDDAEIKGTLLGDHLTREGYQQEYFDCGGCRVELYRRPS